MMLPSKVCRTRPRGIRSLCALGAVLLTRAGSEKLTPLTIRWLGIFGCTWPNAERFGCTVQVYTLDAQSTDTLGEVYLYKTSPYREERCRLEAPGGRVFS